MNTASLCIALAVASVAPAAHAEIFKCMGPAGRITYQNFPCQLESIGSVAIPAPKAATAPPTDAALPRRRGQVISAADISPDTTPPGEPRVGMTPAEVRAAWGEPTTVVQTEFAEGLVDVWTYDDRRSVEFSYKGRVRAVNR